MRSLGEVIRSQQGSPSFAPREISAYDASAHVTVDGTANPQTKNLEFRVFDSVRFSILRCGIPRSFKDFPEI